MAQKMNNPVMTRKHATLSKKKNLGCEARYCTQFQSRGNNVVSQTVRICFMVQEMSVCLNVCM